MSKNNDNEEVRRLREKIDPNKLPKHIAIIMDGNGRWAYQKGKQRINGHKEGVNSVKDVVKGSGEIGIRYLTLYVFSTENWKRPKAETEALMNLLSFTITSEISNLNNNNVRLLTIGDIEALPNNISSKVRKAVSETASNTGLSLVLALNYSSRQDIAKATYAIARDVKDNTISLENITEGLISDYLSTSDIPDPELLIRTSGEFRLSNFLLWEIVYGELYFPNTLWPDFKKKDLYKAILNYQNRERRFGKISEQLL